ncbi:hypothetical protein Rhopal_001307-T1 [Rhodotorula paludigena]|uniref:Uncharacterized protein n=1 Tax=Rhodotorula paludigena TaxID=86838 RepID=A0AAV5GH14_9BASI|nr:hypothetical protein Rhopal_001307-T1 [Rhodotorula paludigena]
MAPLPKQHKSKRGSQDQLPYRRGVTLGKAMRRGKLASASTEGREPKLAGRSRTGGAQGSKGAVDKPPRVAEADKDDELNDGDEEMDGEEEWTGVVSSPAPEEVPAAPQTAVKGKGKARKKAGGPGKQPKTFVEEKSDLLSLAAAITGQAEEKAKAKLERAKNKPARPVVTGKKEPSDAKQKQLAAARAVVSARAKAKKNKHKAAAAPPPAAPTAGAKKRVSFA